MRVIAGSQKGRTLTAPPRRGVRPTSDRVREALFSIVGSRIQDARVLDLYAGTGAVGIEALSRGAAHVSFVESEPQALRTLRANLTRCGFAGTATVHALPVSRFFRTGSPPDDPYHLVFADPPYTEEVYEELSLLLAQSRHIGPNTLVVIEHATKTVLPTNTGALTCLRHYRYGDTTLSVLAPRREGTPAL